MITSALGRHVEYNIFVREGEDRGVFNQALHEYLSKVIVPSSNIGLLVDDDERRYFGIGTRYDRTPQDRSLDLRGLSFKEVDLINPQNQGPERRILVCQINRLLAGLDIMHLSKNLNDFVDHKFFPSFDVRPHPEAVKAYQKALDDALRNLDLRMPKTS